MKLKLKFNIKIAINIIAAILLITIIIVGSIKNTELNGINNELRANIEAKKNTINNLTHENENLSSNVTRLNNSIAQLEESNSKLQEDNGVLDSKVQELLSVIENLKDNIAQMSASKKDFKSYMPYQIITNRSSKQWELQQVAYTNEDGIRCVDGLPMIAIGTGWGLWVGDKVLVTCANGNSFKAIVGDIKSDAHTDEERKTTADNGCRCEFLVDVSKIDPTAKIMGSMAILDKYKGYVVNIEMAN